MFRHLFLLTTIGLVGQNAASDPGLTTVRDEFRQQAKSLSEQLVMRIDKAIGAARKNKMPKAAAALQREKTAFIDAEVLPTHAAVDVAVREYLSGLRKTFAPVEAAYEKALMAHAAASEPAKRLRAELEGLRPYAAHDEAIDLASLIVKGSKVLSRDAPLILQSPGPKYLPTPALTPQRYMPPLAIAVRAKTDFTNLRLHFGAASLVFNAANRPTDLILDDPTDKKGNLVIEGKGRVEPDVFHDIVWEFRADLMRVIVNGVERYRNRGAYGEIRGVIGVGPAYGSTVTIESLVIRRKLASP